MKLSDYESGLQIELEAEFIVKFDEHQYYTSFSGKGLKGVDYLMISDGYLYLIEIKNFSQYHVNRAFAQKERPSSPDKTIVNQQFYQKCEDTLIVIEKFHQFLESSFWTKIFILRYRWFFTGPKEWKYWLQAYDLYRANKVIMLLHVEN